MDETRLSKESRVKARHEFPLYKKIREFASSLVPPPAVEQEAAHPAIMSSTWAQTIQLITKALSPIPKYQFTPGNDDNTKETGLLQDLQHLNIEDYKTLKDILEATVTGVEDDNGFLQERTVTLLAKLPPNSKDCKEATDAFVNTLWDSLEHPPARLSSKDARYREADGSYNNPDVPSMGAANTRYARTTPAMVFKMPNLPEPSLIFDSLMSRGDGSAFREHPNRISSMLFYLATIITHDIFQTVSSCSPLIIFDI